MSRHRSEPPPRQQARYGRVAVLVVSLLTTGIALLGGVGVLPSAADDDDVTTAIDPLVAVRTPAAAADANEAEADVADAAPRRTRTRVTTAVEAPAPAADETALPADSGEGRRVVFSEDRQRVWLVASTGAVRRTYLVSGSLTDNLDPGTYEVYSRSEDATGIDDSGTMKWFVRFTQGPTGAAIGFHTIPVDDGRNVQTRAQLGTPQSHGCIRQTTPDALALWSFAPLGTTVVVV